MAHSLEPGGPRSIGIVFATPQEAGPFCSRLNTTGTPIARRESPGGVTIFEVSSLGVRWVISGMGRTPAHRAAEALVDAGVDWLVSAGVSGGIDPDLKVGSIVEVVSLVDESGARWTTHGLERPETQRVAGLCSSQILTYPAQKSLARQQWSADVVDLEGAGVAEVAALRSIPFSSLRAISDAAHERLPLAFDRYIGPEGGLNMAALAAAVALRPWTIPALIRLAFRTAASSRILAVILVEVARSNLAGSIAAPPTRE